MEDYVQFSAKTKSEAITKACIELGVSSDQLEVQVISEGKSGFLGIGSKPAVIKVRKMQTADSTEDEMREIVETVKMESIKEEQSRSARKPAPKAEPVKEKKAQPAQSKEKKEAKQEAKPEKPAAEAKAAESKPAKPAQQAKKEPRASKEPKERQPKAGKERPNKERPAKEQKETKEVKEKVVKPSKPIEIITDPEEIKAVEESAKVFLQEVFASMDLGEVEIKSVYNTTDGCLEVDFEGADMGILIGKRGQTLDSLQYLTSLVVNKGKANYIRVKLDTEDYRHRRRETLENLARGIAYKVRKTRKAVVLEPMNPYERRIIHSALQGNKFVETVSEGDEPYRHVVVRLKKF